METNTEAVAPQKQAEPEERESPFALLLELEGVVLDARQAAFDVLQSILSDHKIEFSPPAYSRYCLLPAPEYYVPNLLEELGAKKLSASKLVEDVNSGVAMHLSSGERVARPGCKALLRTAKAHRIPVGVLSVLPTATAESIVKKLELDKAGVRLFAFHDEREETFPRPDTWLKMAKAMNRPARRCVVFGSSSDACRAAMSAGMRCIAVPDAFTSFQDFGGAKRVLDSLEDLSAEELIERFCPADA